MPYISSGQRPQPMNLKDLKYLVALADTGHFGRAAQRTFVSQPTLSAQLKKLEEYLGVKLVERHPKNVQLTEVGKQIVARARRMLSEGDEIVALARNNTDPLRGKLKIALIPTIGPYLLPRVMQKLRKALPHLGLMLYEHQTEELLKRLQGRRDRSRHPRAAGRSRRPGVAARCIARKLHGRAAERQSARAESPPSRSPISKVRRCCCWRTAIACAIRRSRSAAASMCARPRIFAPPASRRCGTWWWPDSASP